MDINYIVIKKLIFVSYFAHSKKFYFKIQNEIYFLLFLFSSIMKSIANNSLYCRNYYIIHNVILSVYYVFICLFYFCIAVYIFIKLYILVKYIIIFVECQINIYEYILML